MDKKIVIIFSLIVLVIFIVIGAKFFDLDSKSNILKGESLFALGNSHLDKAVQDYLLSQKDFSWKTEDESHNFCVFENLDSKNELFPFYLWVRCGEFIVQDNKLKELSGMSGPVKIDYPNQLSFYDLEKFSHITPRDGSLYSEDIKNIFSVDLQRRINNFDSTIISERIKNLARNNF